MEDFALEEFAWEALLYDFYGELLNERQRDVYRAYVMEDLSLSEIAETRGISRQAVSTMLGRCRKALREYEETLRLAAKFQEIRGIAEEIRSLSSGLSDGETAGRICDLTDRILTEL